MNKIVITSSAISLEAELNDGPTAKQVWEALPIKGRANIWGDEIYFEIPVNAAQEPNARADVEIGELAYWPMGNAFCIFWGPTPASIGPKPRAYSPVNILGRVLGDATQFAAARDGDVVMIERAE